MNTFYDIHMHAFNLNHPNLSEFLVREDLIDSLIDQEFDFGLRVQLFAASFCFKSFIKKKINEKLNSGNPSLKDKFGNTLSFFEVPLEYQFLILDYFIKTGSPAIYNPNKQIVIGEKAYDKMVLCPLVMDFGFKNIPKKEKNGVLYNLTPKRPIVNQIGDLLYAIRTYFRFELEVDAKNKKMDLSSEIPDSQKKKNEKLFEIYPFMGLDTRNYTLDKLEKMLEMYFKNFTKDESGETRRNRLFAKMGKLDSNMYDTTPDYYTDIFAGIKLYPQMGFDPYPSDPEELEKVQYLYKFCIDKRIPITTHCSDGGYKTGKDNDKLTSPLGQWKNVFEAKDKNSEHLFSGLTLNFAHFGSQKKNNRQWRNEIIELTKKHPNVYADISCNDMTPGYYNELGKLFNDKNPQLHEKVLYGSDFSINMLASNVESYNQYLEAFVKSNLTYKTNLCEFNPKKFLFGKD